MQFQRLTNADNQAVAQFFTNTFTASAGAQEGATVGALATQLAAVMGDGDVQGYGTMLGDDLVAAVVFSRLVYAQPLDVMLLSPMAVATAQQRQGVGQGLIQFALAALAAQNVEVVVTYGDPAFYGKLGFTSLSESILPAPKPLSMPHGWLGLSLCNQPIPTRTDRPHCVAAFDDAALW